MRPDPRGLSPAEQAATDAAVEDVIAHLKRVLRPGKAFDRAAHQAWLNGRAAHSEACDCAGCVGAGP